MRPVIALLLRCYPARWRARYGDEFAAVLAERPLGPFDVADVLLGALDAHLHLRGHGGASEHRKGFAKTLRIGGYGAMAGAVQFLAGFLANTFDGSDDAWPASGITLAGIVLLLVGMVGLSAHQARRHPTLVWAAFLVPAVGAIVASMGVLLMGLFPDADGDAPLSPWGLTLLGLVTLMAGSGLFAYATWRTGMLSRAGTALLGIAGLLVVPGIVGALGAWPWESLVAISLSTTLVTFAAGWLLTGIAAVRADHVAYRPAGGTA
jgi:hypothetical protein